MAKNTKKTEFYFETSNTEKYRFIQTTNPQGAYELEKVKGEIKRNVIEEGHLTGENRPFLIKSNSSTLGCIIENSRKEQLNSFVQDGSIRDF